MDCRSGQNRRAVGQGSRGGGPGSDSGNGGGKAAARKYIAAAQPQPGAWRQVRITA